MKIYTMEDYNNFEFEGNRRQCPSGDYTQIKSFGDNDSFASDCAFGEKTVFGANCSFGERCNFFAGCKFGPKATFGADCYFERNCKFDYNARFGFGCQFERSCKIGGHASFGEYCKFGNNCKFEQFQSFGCNITFGDKNSFKAGSVFGDSNHFGENCSMEGKEFTTFLRVEGLATIHRTVNFFYTPEKELFIQDYRFVGTLEEYMEWVKNNFKQCIFEENIIEEFEFIVEYAKRRMNKKFTQRLF